MRVECANFNAGACVGGRDGCLPRGRRKKIGYFFEGQSCDEGKDEHRAYKPTAVYNKLLDFGLLGDNTSDPIYQSKRRP